MPPDPWKERREEGLPCPVVVFLGARPCGGEPQPANTTAHSSTVIFFLSTVCVWLWLQIIPMLGTPVPQVPRIHDGRRVGEADEGPGRHPPPLFSTSRSWDAHDEKADAVCLPEPKSEISLAIARDATRNTGGRRDPGLLPSSGSCGLLNGCIKGPSLSSYRCPALLAGSSVSISLWGSSAPEMEGDGRLGTRIHVGRRPASSRDAYFGAKRRGRIGRIIYLCGLRGHQAFANARRNSPALSRLGFSVLASHGTRITRLNRSGRCVWHAAVGVVLHHGSSSGAGRSFPSTSSAVPMSFAPRGAQNWPDLEMSSCSAHACRLFAASSGVTAIRRGVWD